jgi:ERO1-like protein alpha
MLPTALLKALKLGSVALLFLWGYLSVREFLDFTQLPMGVNRADGSVQIGTLVEQLRPVLSELSHQKFFRYFRVDVSTGCPFWGNEAKCTRKEQCKLNCKCLPENLPTTWTAEDMRIRENEAFSTIQFTDMMKPQKQAVDRWRFDTVTENSIYVDLLGDREEYTGYQGQKIWNELYQDNCLKVAGDCDGSDLMYRMISGMHSSVSSHLSEYFIEFGRFGRDKIVYANDALYFEKVGNHKDRIGNLIFSVQTMLRAVVRYADVIKDFNVDTGDFNTDMKTGQLLQRLIGILNHQKDLPFDERVIFGEKRSQEQQRATYLSHFTNMTRLMDCVDCLKCKAYGKMQILGLSAGLKILLRKEDTALTRNELVAMVNTLNKWTESIQIIDRMRQRLLNRIIAKSVHMLVGTMAVFIAVELLLRKRLLDSVKQKSE